MKAFKKITALALTLAMLMTSMLTTSVFAELKFNDVDDSTAYSAAIYNLVSEGIINGYDNGDGTSSFKPDATITRAEFAKIVVMTREGANAAFNQTTTNFPDMAGSEWAIPYVAHATGLGIINGYEDGTFRPEATVTYAEVVKMIVCALGYGPVVDTTLDPWYTGYINLANQIGVTKSVGSLPDNEAPRGMVAQLCDNMLDTDRLVQTGTDANGKPTYSTSKGDIITNNDTTDSEGVVTAVFDNSLRGSDDAVNKSQIKIDDTIYALSDTLKNTDLNQFLGRGVKFTYTGSSKYTVTSIKAYGKYDTLEITDEQFDSASLTSMTYYEDPDNDNKTKSVNLDKDLYIVYNGVGVPKASISADLLQLANGTITLVNNDSDSAYDIAYVDSYKTYFVNAPVTNNGVTTIYDKSNYEPKIELNEDDVKAYKITTAGGAKTEAKLSSVVNKSVVSIAQPLTQTSGTTVMISTATVTGSVTSMSDDYNNIVVSSKEYKVAPYFRKLLADNESTYKFSVGSNVKFYLDFMGRIVSTDVTVSTDPYGYLMDYNAPSGIGGDYQVRIMSGSNGKWTTYTLADNVRINGTSVKAENVGAELESSAARINSAKSGVTDENFKSKNDRAAQVVKYKVSNNKITELTTIGTGDDGGITAAKFSTDGGEKTEFSDCKNTLKYSRTGYAFKDSNGGTQFTMNSSTIVLVVPCDRSLEAKYKKSTYSIFSNDSSYRVEPYDITTGGTVAKVVVYYVSSSSESSVNNVGAGTNVSAIVDYKKGTEDGKEVYRVTVRSFGEEQDKEIITDELSQINGFNKGDLIKYTLSNGAIDDIKKQFDFETKTLVGATGNMIKTKYDGTEGYYTAICGTVYSIDLEDGKGVIGVAPAFATAGEDGKYTLDSSKYESFSVTDKTPYYMYDTSGRNPQLVEKSYGELVAALDNANPETATKVVLIMINKTVKGVYILE